MGRALGPGPCAWQEAVRAVAEIFRGNAALLRASMHLGTITTRSPAAAPRAASTSPVASRRRCSRTATSSRTRIPTPPDVAYRMAYSTFARQVMYGPDFESDRTISWDDLVAEVGSACAAYLLAALENV